MPANMSVLQAVCNICIQGCNALKARMHEPHHWQQCHLMRRRAFVSRSNVLQLFWLHNVCNGWHHRSSTSCKHKAVPISIRVTPAIANH